MGIQIIDFIGELVSISGISTIDSIIDNEIAFIKSFPNISVQLFENDLIDEKIKNHPMIRWKQSLLK